MKITLSNFLEEINPTAKFEVKKYEEEKVLKIESLDIEFYENKVIGCKCNRILIVDDNNFNVFSLKTMIEYDFKLDIDCVSLI
jgi:hypothetical protein